MDVLVICSDRNYQLGVKILGKINGINVIYYSTSHPQINSDEIINKISLCNGLFMLIIDSDDKIFDRYNLHLAINKLSGNSNNIINVVINNSFVPGELSLFPILKFNPQDKEEINDIRKEIRNFLTKTEKDNKKFFNSSKKEIEKKFDFLLLTICLFSLILTISILTLDNKITNNVLGSIIVLITLGTSIVPLMISYSLGVKKKKNKIKQQENENYINKVKNAILLDEINQEEKNVDKNDKVKSPNALARMLLNIDAINEYYIWSQKQAKHSFVFAVIMCVIGILLLSFPLILTFITQLPIHISVITTVGGVITEFISISALFIYKSSFEQLNHYHKALHEDERFLSSINLLDKFKNEENYDMMLTEIIKSEIEMNLISINLEEKTSKNNK